MCCSVSHEPLSVLPADYGSIACWAVPGGQIGGGGDGGDGGGDGRREPRSGMACERLSDWR